MEPENLKKIEKFKKLYKKAQKIEDKNYSFGYGNRPWVVERLHAPLVLWQAERLLKKIKESFMQTMNLKEFEGLDEQAKHQAWIDMLPNPHTYKNSVRNLESLVHEIKGFLKPQPEDIPERDTNRTLKNIKKLIKGGKERLNKWKSKRTEKNQGKSVQAGSGKHYGEEFGKPINIEIKSSKIKTKGPANSTSVRKISGRSISL